MDNNYRLPSAPSEAAHSVSFSTDKTLVPSSPSTVPGDESGYSEATQRRLAILKNEVPRLKEGWPHLAYMMAEKPHVESFCRFRELNVKNLLYYQVEIAEKEAELRIVENDDWEKSGHEGTYAKKADMMLLLNPELVESVATPQQRRQRDLVVEIRELLRQYSKMEQRLQ